MKIEMRSDAIAITSENSAVPNAQRSRRRSCHSPANTASSEGKFTQFLSFPGNRCKESLAWPPLKRGFAVFRIQMVVKASEDHLCIDA